MRTVLEWVLWSRARAAVAVVGVVVALVVVAVGLRTVTHLGGSDRHAPSARATATADPFASATPTRTPTGGNVEQSGWDRAQAAHAARARALEFVRAWTTPGPPGRVARYLSPAFAQSFYQSPDQAPAGARVRAHQVLSVNPLLARTSTTLTDGTQVVLNLGWDGLNWYVTGLDLSAP